MRLRGGCRFLEGFAYGVFLSTFCKLYHRVLQVLQGVGSKPKGSKVD